MSGALHALITFSSNGERNRAISALQTWVTNWNAAHPTELFSGSTTSTTYLYPADDEAHAGVNARALIADYLCTNYSGIEDAQRAIAVDVNANAFWDIVNLSTSLVLP